MTDSLIFKLVYFKKDKNEKINFRINQLMFQFFTNLPIKNKSLT